MYSLMFFPPACPNLNYCKTRKFHLWLIFAISDDEANPWTLNAAESFILLMISKGTGTD